MLILIVLICILIWYGVKRYKRSKEADGLLDEGEMSLRREIREIVLKYKLLILIGSTVVVIGSIGWMYYIFYVPYSQHHVGHNSTDTWQFGSRFVWVRFFAKSARRSGNSSNQNVCGEFSKDQCLHNMEILKNYSILNTSVETLHRLSVNHSEAREQMYTIKTKIPIVITQSSADNFGNVQEFVRESEAKLLPQFPDFQILIYDMGMSFQQKYVLLNCTQCQVIEDFPENLTSHSWTPVIMYLSLKRYKSIIWVNASTVEIDDLQNFILNESQFPGFQVNLSPAANYQPRRSFPNLFLNRMKEDRLQNSIESTLETLLVTKKCEKKARRIVDTKMIYANTSPFTMQNIIIPWTLCSVNGECMTKDRCKLRTRTDSATFCNYDSMYVDLLLHSLFGNAASLFYS